MDKYKKNHPRLGRNIDALNVSMERLFEAESQLTGTSEQSQNSNFTSSIREQLPPEIHKNTSVYV